MAAAPVKYYTYAPGAGKPNTIKLAPGQKLGFQKGRGYFAKAPEPISDAASGGGYGAVGVAPEPISDAASGGGYRPTTRPTAGVSTGVRTAQKGLPVDPYAALSAAEIERRATELANSGLNPQEAEIRRQQALAQQNAMNDEAAIRGFSTAAGQLEAGIAPEVSAAYHTATQDQGALGQGISGQVGADLAAKQQAEDAFAQSQGQGTGHEVNPTDVQASLGMLQGVIPGERLAAEGAAQATLAAKAPIIQLDAGRQELDKRMAQAKADGDGYAQQLIAKAAEFPGLKAQALQQLNQYELDKANYRDRVLRENQDNARQNRSLRDNETIAGIKAQDAAAKQYADYKYKWATLRFKSQHDAALAQAAAKKGQQPNAALSKAYGYIVDSHGNAITGPNGARIPVAKTSSTSNPRTKALVNRAKATGVAQATAQSWANRLYASGKPQKFTGIPPSVTGPDGKSHLAKVGQFVAAPKYARIPPGKPGAVFHTHWGFPDDVATTDKGGRAARQGAPDYAHAQAQVFNAIKGDQLMAQYGYSREQVMAMVNNALQAAGFQQ